jgi:DNA polymerase-3 subunit epsilon
MGKRTINQNDWVILDTETTGLYILRLWRLRLLIAGEPLLNTLVQPSISIPAEVTEIHGITDEMVAASPTFPEVYSRIVEALEGKRVLIYNSVSISRFWIIAVGFIVYQASN